MSFYTSVFVEAAKTASIIPFFSSESSLAAMRAFGGFDMQLAFGLALAGAAVGTVFNWCLGTYLAKRYREKNARLARSETKYLRIQKIFGKVGYVFLLVSFLPLMNFAVLAGGFFRLRARIALPLVFAGLGWHYYHYLFQ